VRMNAAFSPRFFSQMVPTAALEFSRDPLRRQ
jgi:hypothetical protein